MKFSSNFFKTVSCSLVGCLVLVNEAFADAAPASAAQDSAGSNALAQGLMLAAFAAIFYFLILRPQNKRAKEHRNLISGLQKGDEILTSGGLLGKVTKITDDFLHVSIADGVEVTLQKQAVAAVLPKGTMKTA